MKFNGGWLRENIQDYTKEDIFVCLTFMCQRDFAVDWGPIYLFLMNVDL